MESSTGSNRKVFRREGVVMKYADKTPKELAQKTVRDIERRRKAREEGRKQADIYIRHNKLKAVSNSQRKRMKGGY